MRGQIRQRAHIVAMSPRADPPASRTRNDSPRYLYFYCEEIRLGDDTCQTQFGCIRQKNRTVTHSENNTSQMITNCPSFTKSAQEPNLQAHKAAGIRELIEAAGCRVRYLP